VIESRLELCKSNCVKGSSMASKFTLRLGNIHRNARSQTRSKFETLESVRAFVGIVVLGIAIVASAVIAPSTVFAQVVVPQSQNFSDPSSVGPPSGWIHVNQDGGPPGFGSIVTQASCRRRSHISGTGRS
jgi:hypothetical protein